MSEKVEVTDAAGRARELNALQALRHLFHGLLQRFSLLQNPILVSVPLSEWQLRKCVFFKSGFSEEHQKVSLYDKKIENS